MSEEKLCTRCGYYRETVRYNGNARTYEQNCTAYADRVNVITGDLMAMVSCEFGRYVLGCGVDGKHYWAKR